MPRFIQLHTDYGLLWVNIKNIITFADGAVYLQQAGMQNCHEDEENIEELIRIASDERAVFSYFGDDEED